MVELNQIIIGLRNYLETELVARMTGIEKWIVGASLSMVLDKGVDVFNELKALPIVKTMGVIDNDDQIDLDRLYQALIGEARKSAITIKMPIVGSVTFKAEDVDRLYQEIKEAKK